MYQQLLGGESILLRVMNEDESSGGVKVARKKVVFRLTCPKARSLLSLAATRKTAYATHSTDDLECFLGS